MTDTDEADEGVTSMTPNAFLVLYIAEMKRLEKKS